MKDFDYSQNVQEIEVVTSRPQVLNAIFFGNILFLTGSIEEYNILVKPSYHNLRIYISWLLLRDPSILITVSVFAEAWE